MFQPNLWIQIYGCIKKQFYLRVSAVYIMYYPFVYLCSNPNLWIQIYGCIKKQFYLQVSAVYIMYYPFVYLCCWEREKKHALSINLILHIWYIRKCNMYSKWINGLRGRVLKNFSKRTCPPYRIEFIIKICISKVKI